MKATYSLSITLAAICFAAFSLHAEDGWVDLFNGQNLDGWEQHSGTAKYTVQDGELIGESVSGSGNSFLCTTKKYGNFELELDYKCDALLNSGVQIRSEVFPEAETLRIDGKGPHGQAFSEQGRTVSKPDEWNHLRILAVGPSIQTWLNGVKRADIYDGLTTNGIIGLQVHGVGKDEKRVGLKIAFRNIRIREINPEPNTLSGQEKAEGWQLLWDGQTTDGWRTPKSDEFPTKSWLITNGEFRVIASGNAEAQQGGDIITRERYSNFDLRVEFKMTPGCNSGIKIFVQPNIAPVLPNGQRAKVGSAIGMEYQILDDLRHPDAKLGRNGDRKLASLYDLIPAPADKVVMPMGEWNQARILSQGKHVTFWLNGFKTVEFERGSPEFRQAVALSKFHNIPDFGEWADGHILLQEHGSEVSFRNVKIRVLPAQ
jgi:hypothetical protein